MCGPAIAKNLFAGRLTCFRDPFLPSREKTLHKAGRFFNPDGFFRWQFLNDLDQPGLNFAQAFDLHNNSSSFISNMLPFTPDQLYEALPVPYRTLSKVQRDAKIRVCESSEPTMNLVAGNC